MFFYENLRKELAKFNVWNDFNEIVSADQKSIISYYLKDVVEIYTEVRESKGIAWAMFDVIKHAVYVLKLIIVWNFLVELFKLSKSLFWFIYYLILFSKKNPTTWSFERSTLKQKNLFKEIMELEILREERMIIHNRLNFFENFNIFLKNYNNVGCAFFLNQIKYNSFSNLNYFRYLYRIFISKIGFFSLLQSQSNDFFFKGLKSSFFAGLYSFWKALRLWLFALVIAVAIFYYSMVIRCVPFNKIIFVWLVVGMFAYWLLSGFVFFVKKYQFGKFTSAIQRFWRRSYILFWLIEFSLFSVFFYLTLNANNESWYMYDQLQVFKSGLFSWRSFILKIFPLTLLLIFGYLLLLTLKWNVFGKHALWLFTITVILLYVVWLEFYQFFHVVNFYGNFNWVFDIDEKIWSLELEVRKSRTVNHYIMLMVLLKFWHIVFIFVIWIFFVLRSVEIGRIRYPLLSANLQNFLILYLFAWVMMFPWLKFVFRRYLDMPYYWFYVNNRRVGYRVFFNDIGLYYYSLSDFVYYQFIGFKNFFKNSFFYWWCEDDYFAVKKSLIKHVILNSLRD